MWFRRLDLTIAAKDSLIRCLLEMADAETNPVLELIDLNKPLEENKKYPPDLLQFNHTGWRAYYHCHPASRAGNHRFQGEHGHFHLFVRTQTEPETWSHLVALSIDPMGQPLGWFTVNHWVTGETWESSRDLVKYLLNIPYDSQSRLVECWLLSLLALSHDLVDVVLHERDKVIEEKQSEEGSDIKQHKGLYLLSEISMELKKLLDSKEPYG